MSKYILLPDDLRNKNSDGMVTPDVPLAWQGQFCKAELKEPEDRAGRRKDRKTTSTTRLVIASHAV